MFTSTFFVQISFTAKELYSIVADVDSYKDFLPFTTESKVLNSQLVNLTTKERMKTNLNEKGWLNLNDNNEGELFELEAELKIGAMGYNESYISLVKAKKWESVSVSILLLSLFFLLLPTKLHFTTPTLTRQQQKIQKYLNIYQQNGN